MSRPGSFARILFRAYKATLSPMLHAVSPTQCKFLPTCSEYAYVAVARHGVAVGLALTLRRLARCHPFAVGGLDPVPARRTREHESATQGGASKPQRLS